MMWVGLIVGMILGAFTESFAGVAILGFLGWLAGLIIGSKWKADKARVVNERFERIEQSIGALEMRLASLELKAEHVVAAPVHAKVEVEVATAPEPEVIEPPPKVIAIPPAPPPPPPPPPEPPKPNPFMAWLTGGNTIARVGLLILFFGLAFLLKYAAERNLVPVEFRVAGIAIAGIVMVVLGWRLRPKNAAYALALQGGGIGVMYLTTFGALKLYHLIPAEMAFVLLAAIAVFSAFMAIAQDAVILAAFGAGGGFLAPVLASTGGGSHVMLFSYYLLLNAGILAIAWFKAWRSLNLMGFLFTFFIGLSWGMKFYQPEYFDTTEPFLVAFFLMYVAIQILFTRHRAPGNPRIIDGTLVFGTPLAAFGLQAALTRGMEFAMAYSCVAAGAMYLLLATAMKKRGNPDKALLVEAYFALGVVFATLAIPFALDARWTSAAWAVEGAAIIWFGIRQQRKLARLFGLMLQPAAAGAYVLAYPALSADVPLLDARFIGAVLLSVAGCWIARLWSRGDSRVTEPEKDIAPLVFLWGIAWWLFGVHHEVTTFVDVPLQIPAGIGALAATALVWLVIARRLEWELASWPAVALLPVLVAMLFSSVKHQPHPFADYGWAAWIGALAVQAWILWETGSQPALGRPAPRYIEGLHAGTMVLVAALGAMELHWLAVENTAPHTAWSVASVIVVPALLVLAASTSAARSRWPVMQNAAAYRVDALAPIALAMLLWSLYANVTHDGTSDPLPYAPFLNALDLGHILAALSLLAAWHAWRRDPVPWPISQKAGWIAAAVMAFIWLNGVLLRSLHHYMDIPFRAQTMAHSVVVQAALSIFWSALALSLMVVATKKAVRPLWVVGASLMGVVVVKLFIVDLENVGGIERVVSFIAVGVLMLVVGYFSPVPPKS